MSHFGSVYITFLMALFIAFFGQDAAVVNPKIVKVEFENQKVRILRAHYAPHARLEMHSHPTKAEIQINDGVVRLFSPDGQVRDDPGKAGQFFWLEPTTHAVENVGSDSLELVEIEMKDVTAQSIPVTAPPPSKSTAAGEPRAVEQEPHHRWEFQNQYVRVLDVLLAPGESTLFHTHSHDSIGVQLSKANIQEQIFEQDWRPASKVEPGDVKYAEGGTKPYTHRVKNVGSTPFHVIDIELLK